MLLTMSAAADDKPTTLLPIKVVPGSSRDTVAGYVGERLKIKVAAPPEAGKANAAVIRVLADALDLPPGALAIARGQTSPTKTVQVAGLSDNQLRKRIQQALKQ